MPLTTPDREPARRRAYRRRRTSTSGSVDYRKEFAHLYSGSEKRVDLVHAPKMNYLELEGSGDPSGSNEFRIAADLLCRLSLEIRLAVSRADVMDFVVMPLECVWWNTRIPDPPVAEPTWSVMIMQPVVSPAILEEAVERLAREIDEAERLGRVRLVKFYEGPAAQTLARSPEPCSPAALDRIGAWIAENGHVPTGAVHEIFLDGFCTTPGSRSQRLIRRPVTPADPV